MTLYIGCNALASMTREATEDLIDIHQKYVNSIQRLPLAPQIVNINRKQEEKLPTGNITQSTRNWANSVKLADGKSLQCDAENRGKTSENQKKSSRPGFGVYLDQIHI
jgi:hypothetical protein